MDFKRLFSEVRDKGFAEINSRFIPSNKYYFAHASAMTGNINYNLKNILALKFTTNAVKGVIAHELAHQVDFKRRNFFAKLWLNYKCKTDEFYRRGIERTADKITVQRGFGRELLEAMKLTKENFPIDKWKRYKKAHLSMKEVKDLMKKLFQ
mgnify:CR=1 FL=1